VPAQDVVDPGYEFASAGWPSSAVPPARHILKWILSYCSNGIRYFLRRRITDYDPAEAVHAA
jgi:hypothetical protein